MRCTIVCADSLIPQCHAPFGNTVSDKQDSFLFGNKAVHFALPAVNIGKCKTDFTLPLVFPFIHAVHHKCHIVLIRIRQSYVIFRNGLSDRLSIINDTCKIRCLERCPVYKLNIKAVRPPDLEIYHGSLCHRIVTGGAVNDRLIPSSGQCKFFVSDKIICLSDMKILKQLIYVLRSVDSLLLSVHNISRYLCLFLIQMAENRIGDQKQHHKQCSNDTHHFNDTNIPFFSSPAPCSHKIISSSGFNRLQKECLHTLQAPLLILCIIIQQHFKKRNLFYKNYIFF